VKKIYPVVLYPPKILKFLANNPTLDGTNSLPADSHDKSNKRPQIKFSWHQLPKSTGILLFFVSSGMALSFAFLSPFWLVAIVWIVISMGIMVSLLTDMPHELNSKKGYQKRPDISTHAKPQSETMLRSPNRLSQLRSLLSDSVMLSVGIGNAQVGVSEKAFKQALQQIFPNIVQGLQFQNPQHNIPYAADFALIHESGLSIDIEVDEPYVGNTKQPHHCTNQGKDDSRNQFFLNGNWVVVRFSEKQVVLYPFSCGKVIASVIARIAGDYTYLNKLQGVPDLPADPMWTTRQAKKWAKENYRKTYLPKRGY
jgi:very-short-patch-repair endonuclease